MSKFTITVEDVKCPKCGSGEMNPKTAHLPFNQRTILIRGFKVQDKRGNWWSQCLVCAGVFDKQGNDLPYTGDWREGGWFCS